MAQVHFYIDVHPSTDDPDEAVRLAKETIVEDDIDEILVVTKVEY